MHKEIPSKTAELGAMVRSVACSNNFGKSVFNDPFAIRFLGYRTIIPFISNILISGIVPSFWRIGMNSVGFMLSLCRHRYMYDTISKYITKSDNQVIIIGAGYDTSCLLFNEHLSENKLFEIDHPATQKRKKRILDKYLTVHKNVSFIPLDLSVSTIKSVSDAFSRKHSNHTVVIIEGVLSYLYKEKIEEVLRDLTKIGSKVTVVADYRRNELLEKRSFVGNRWLRSFKKMGEKYESFFSIDEIEALLVKNGYKIVEHADLLDLWLRYSKLLPNMKLKNYGGIFKAEYVGN